MSDRDLMRLQHMVMCCESILKFAKGKRISQLATDQLLDCAIRHQLQVLGEAANAISKKTKDKLPEIPWKQVVGLRHKLIHEYFDINYEIIWKTIKTSIPELLSELKKYLSQREAP